MRRRVGAAILASALLAGCNGSSTLEGVTILKYGLQTGSPAALISGSLRFRNGCTLIEANGDEPKPTWMILWPPTTGLGVLNGRVQIVLGSVAATDGDGIELGGGEQTDQAWVEHLVGPVGPCHAAQYWMASSLTVAGR